MIGPAGPPCVARAAGVARPSPGCRHRQPACQRARSGRIVWHVRMPRVVLAGIVGAMLSVGGAAYQGVFRNPLVDPYLLGAAAGAGLGATLVYRRVPRRRRATGRSTRCRSWRSCSRSATVAVTYLVGASFGGAALERDARARRRGDGVADDGDPDVRAAAQHRGRARGLHVDPRPGLDGDVERRAARDAVRHRSVASCCSCTAATSTCCASATTRRRRSACPWRACGSSSWSRRRSARRRSSP